MSFEASPWINTRIERVNSAVLAERGRDVLKHLARLGITIPPRNRIERASRFVDNVNDNASIIRPDDPGPSTRFLEALRTLFDAFTVVWTLVARPQRVNPFPNERLEALLRGADLPSDDANAHYRNVQFELTVGVQLIMGGVDLEPGEPDYTMLYWGQRVGLAAKRLVSLKPQQLRKRLSEAADQIERATGQGFVAVSLDSWISDLAGESLEEFGQKFSNQLQGAHRQLDKVSHKRALLGAMIIGNWSRWRFDGPKPAIEWRSPTQFIALVDSDEDPEKAKAAEFINAVRVRHDASLAELATFVA